VNQGSQTFHDVVRVGARPVCHNHGPCHAGLLCLDHDHDPSLYSHLARDDGVRHIWLFDLLADIDRPDPGASGLYDSCQHQGRALQGDGYRRLPGRISFHHNRHHTEKRGVHGMRFLRTNSHGQGCLNQVIRMPREVAPTKEYYQLERFLCFVDLLVQCIRIMSFQLSRRVHLARQAMPRSELDSDQPWGRSFRAKRVWIASRDLVLVSPLSHFHRKKQSVQTENEARNNGGFACLQG